MHFYCLFVSRTASHFLIIEKTNKVLKKKKLVCNQRRLRIPQKKRVARFMGIFL